MKIKIVFDNYIFDYEKDLEKGWGFSCMIGEDFLFDTGNNGRVLLRNMEKLGFDIQKLKYLFISHPHWDHMGGIDSIVDQNRELTLFLPESVSDLFIEDLKNYSKKIKVIKHRPVFLFDRFYSTGVMEPIGEQSLVIDMGNYGAVITGCAHPGIINIVKRAKKVLGKTIFYALGGFHLMDSSKGEIIYTIETLKKLGVKYITPTHCSGDLSIKMFREVYKDRFIEGGVGAIIEI